MAEDEGVKSSFTAGEDGVEGGRHVTTCWSNCASHGQRRQERVVGIIGFRHFGDPLRHALDQGRGGRGGGC
eukprot:scaffold106808_cov15-Tisochrysis_lutea.AAC.1